MKKKTALLTILLALILMFTACEPNNTAEIPAEEMPIITKNLSRIVSAAFKHANNSGEPELFLTEDLYFTTGTTVVTTETSSTTISFVGGMIKSRIR